MLHILRSQTVSSTLGISDNVKNDKETRKEIAHKDGQRRKWTRYFENGVKRRGRYHAPYRSLRAAALRSRGAARVVKATAHTTTA